MTDVPKGYLLLLNAWPHLKRAAEDGQEITVDLLLCERLMDVFKYVDALVVERNQALHVIKAYERSGFLPDAVKMRANESESTKAKT